MGISRLIIRFIKLYQRAISPQLPRSCRFYPSCSHYAIDAYKKYGAIRGSLKAGWRILRCNPFGKGGHDPA